MAMAKVLFALTAIAAVLFSSAITCSQAQDMAPAPAPTSDGTSIDQGIAYVLMLAALVLTYLIHPLDAAAAAAASYKIF